MKIVAYKSENKITNTGDKAWTKEGGLVSVWMLGCFNPTPTTTVFIPYKQDAEGTIVNDEYFVRYRRIGLIKEKWYYLFPRLTGSLFKLGLPVYWYGYLREVMIHRKAYSQSCGVVFRNSFSLRKWPMGTSGRSVCRRCNQLYNDGPVEDGSIMTYEIETSSPGATAPGASLVHTQKVIHVQGKG